MDTRAPLHNVPLADGTTTDNAEPSSSKFETSLRRRRRTYQEADSKETDAAPARDAPWASVTRYRHRPLDYSTPKSPTIDDKYPILRPQISKTPLDHSSIAQANKQNKHPRWGQGATASLPSEPFEGRAAGMHSFGLVDVRGPGSIYKKLSLIRLA